MAAASIEVRPLAGRPQRKVGSEELLWWAAPLDGERLWAVEDCRQLTRWLERQLLAVDEELVRVPPKLTVPERRAGRTPGKSDPIDALAIARAALREPDLSRPRRDEQRYRWRRYVSARLECRILEELDPVPVVVSLRARRRRSRG